MAAHDAIDVIRAKRDGAELTADQIRWVIDAYTHDRVTDGQMAALLMAIFVWGGLAFAIYPIAVAQLIDQLHKDEILAGSSGLLMVNGIGAVCGPLLAGLLMEHLGAAALPLYFAVTLGLLAAYCLYRLRHVSDLVSGDAALASALQASLQG